MVQVENVECELEIGDREDSSCVVELEVTKAEEGLGGVGDRDHVTSSGTSSGRLTLRSFLPWSRVLSPVPLDSSPCCMYFKKPAQI